MNKNGGPAFPRARNVWPDPDNPAIADMVEEQDGMSLRDWFAGMAMAGILGSVRPESDAEDYLRLIEAISLAAYEQADAMLAKRDQ